jgi:uncharacterized membrane protein
MSVVSSAIVMVLYNEFFFPQDKVRMYNNAWFTFYILHLILMSIITTALMYFIFSNLGKGASKLSEKIAARGANKRVSEANRRVAAATEWASLAAGEEEAAEAAALFGF